MLGAGEVMENPETLADGTRLLRHEVLVAAPIEEVWTALGDPKREEVVAWLPNQMQVLRESEGRFTAIELLRINDPNTTRVRITTLPFGPDSKKVYAELRERNAARLRALAARF
jgi:hypothetical protein